MFYDLYFIVLCYMAYICWLIYRKLVYVVRFSGLLFGCFDRLVVWLFWLAGCFGWLFGCLGRLVGCLVGFLVCCLVDLFGWLVG